jgi:hypothetical protein
LICPCKDCLRRTLTCRKDCREFDEWQKEKEQVSERRRQEAEINNYFAERSMRRKRGWWRK